MKKIIYIALVAGILSSCSRDYLDTAPESTINDNQLGTSPAALQGILDGIYTSFRSYGLGTSGNHEDFGHRGIQAAADMMSNDVSMSAFHWFGYHYNYTARNQTSSRSLTVWNVYYPQIKAANTIINAVGEDVSGSESIVGQAKAIRALSYFMLARFYGPTYIGHTSDLCVPLYTEVSLEGGARANVEEIYSLIESDLNDAVVLLQGYSRNSKDKINQAVAQGILAQVYLEMGKYDLAASMAHSARQNFVQPNESQWLDGFYDLAGTPDAMWGAEITAESTTFVASLFAHFDNTDPDGYAGGLGVYKLIDKRLYDAIPENDFRKKAFVSPSGNANYPELPPYADIKYIDKTGGDKSGDYIYMRASEMYYIEAEALARSGNEAAARSVLFEITKLRNPSYTISTKSGQALISEIVEQKRIELWGEGSAWFDMKRLGVDLVRDYAGSNALAAGKFNILAGDKKFLFQIPQREIDANPNIVQNP